MEGTECRNSVSPPPFEAKPCPGSPPLAVRNWPWGLGKKRTKGGEKVKCPVWFGGCRFGGSRSVDCPYSPCSAVIARCERESQWRRQMFQLRKKEKGGQSERVPSVQQ